jgi:alpha-ketoglutarate-dependent taurine dioxygenase
MPSIRPPQPGQPYVIIEAAGEQTVLDADTDLVADLYRQNGALLFRGFATDLERFRVFARRFCSTSVVNESPGRQVLDMEHNILSVDGGMGPFALHPELSREPWKPDAAMFACFSAPRSGGATTICDGVELVREMPDEVRRGLEGRRLLYVKPTWPELLDFWLGSPVPRTEQLMNPPAWCPYHFRQVDGEIVRYFTRPALHRPMFVDGPAFGNFLLFARFNNKRPDFPLLDDGQPVPEEWLQAIKDTGDRLSAPIVWQEGDLLMLDNTRFMHGRQAILDTAERRIGTFFGYVNFAVPDPEEPPDAPWRRADFCPPFPPA